MYLKAIDSSGNGYIVSWTINLMSGKSPSDFYAGYRKNRSKKRQATSPLNDHVASNVKKGENLTKIENKRKLAQRNHDRNVLLTKLSIHIPTKSSLQVVIRLQTWHSNLSNLSNREPALVFCLSHLSFQTHLQHSIVAPRLDTNPPLPLPMG